MINVDTLQIHLNKNKGGEIMTEENLLLNRIITKWTELNLNRSTTAEQRKQEKIASVHATIIELAEKAGIDKEYLEEAMEHHKRYIDPASLLDSYRTYFPEFEELLQSLRISEQMESRLRLKNF